MKKIFLLTLLLPLCAVLPLRASSPVSDNIKVSSVEAIREGDNVTISFELEVGKKAVRCGYSALLMPVITDGKFEWALRPVVAQSRRARIAEERHVMVSGPVVTDDPAVYAVLDSVLSYSVSIPYQQWMDGASLEISSYRAGCGVFEEMDKVAVPGTVKPVFRRQ